MSRFDHQWQALVGMARRAADERDAGAPYGFAARIVAQSAGSYGMLSGVALERFAVRGFLAAAACCVAAVAFNYFGLSGDSSGEPLLEESVNSVLELS